MSEDLTKLETLSYRPVKSPSATLGMNSAVIKPGKRVNKAEGKKLKCKTCNDTKKRFLCQSNAGSHYDDCPDCKSEQPNQNKIIILEIECLISQVNKKIESLSTGAPTTDERFKRKRLKNTALEDIDIFQKTKLFELRKAFE